MANIKIIKLENGTDLIADFRELEKDVYTLYEPMKFFIDYRNDNNLVLQHYLPVQLVKDNMVEIKKQHVLTIVEPDIEFVEYYQHTIEKVKRLMQTRKDIESMTDEEINNIINQMELNNNESGIYH